MCNGNPVETRHTLVIDYTNAHKRWSSGDPGNITKATSKLLFNKHLHQDDGRHGSKAQEPSLSLHSVPTRSERLSSHLTLLLFSVGHNEILSVKIAGVCKWTSTEYTALSLHNAQIQWTLCVCGSGLVG